VLVLERMVVRLGFQCGDDGVVPVGLRLLQLGPIGPTAPVPVAGSQDDDEEESR
jgi:hypothetical protein